MNDHSEDSEIVKKCTIPIGQLEDPGVLPFKWLSQSIYDGKAKLKSNTVKFLVVKILNKQGKVISFDRRNSFDLYVIGSFRSHFIPAETVAIALADFYMEINVLPIIHTITERELRENRKIYINKLRGGVLLYERR